MFFIIFCLSAISVVDYVCDLFFFWGGVFVVVFRLVCFMLIVVSFYCMIGLFVLCCCLCVCLLCVFVMCV